MSTKEIIFILLIFFTCGFVASEVINVSLTATVTIPFLTMIGAFLGVIFIRIKHIDDLNLSRKKDTALEYVQHISEYRSILVSLANPKISDDEFHFSLLDASKNMVGALDKLHVICSDRVSHKIELKNYEIISLMITMILKSVEFGENKARLMKWYVSEDILSKLNVIRYEILHLINSEIGDGSGTGLLKSAIDQNNKDFKKLFLDLLK